MKAARNKCRAAVKSPWRSKIAFAKMQRLLVQLYSHGGLFCCFLGNHISWAPSIQQLLCLKINPITRIKILKCTRAYLKYLQRRPKRHAIYKRRINVQSKFLFPIHPVREHYLLRKSIVKLVFEQTLKMGKIKQKSIISGEKASQSHSCQDTSAHSRTGCLLTCLCHRHWLCGAV